MEVYTPNSKGSLWLPYSVAMIGVVFSSILSYIFWRNIHANYALLESLQDDLPWLTVLIGSLLSIFLAKIIWMAQVAKQRAIILDKINEDLKREVGERIHAEETRQKLEVALLQGQKLQAMGTLAGGIAHDFNNLLYAIIGYAEMARDDVEKDSVIHANLGKILEATHRGQELIARILAFSRRQQHHLETINLNESIEAALSLLRPTIPASVMINFSSEINAIIFANQTQIHQVLVNLINNAVDAMDGEGTITIHISLIKSGDELLSEIPDINSSDDDYCKISITDTGHGMDKQTMERIFEPFYTTKEVGKGTGLGLSIVHTIVKEHKGEIFVTSQLGHGTAFTILLPQHPMI